MATPAAVLSLLVKADGIASTRSQVQGLDKDLERTSKRGAKHLSSLKVAAGALGGIAAFEGLRRGLKAAVGEFEEARKVGGQTTAVLKSTGGQAKVTAKHIQDLAGALSKKTGIDDEAIQSGENLLLTFTKVRDEVGKGNKIFSDATKIAVDMSAALGQDLKSSNIQLGKALNDPVKGVTALQRVGVSFTKSQKKQIEGLVEHGKRLEAQKVILKELTTEFGGAAAAKATPLDKLRVSMGNLAEAVGQKLVPFLDKGARFLTKLVDGMVEGKGVGGALISTFKSWGDTLAPVIESVKEIVGWMQKHAEVAKILGIAIGVLTAAMIALNIAMDTNPIVLAGLALAGLVVAFVTAYRESETFRNIVNTVFGALKTAATVTITAAIVAFNALKDAWHSVTSAVVGEVSQWDLLWRTIKAGVGLMVSIVTAGFDAIKLAFKVGLAVLGPIVTATWVLIKGIFSGAFTAIKGIVTGGFDVLRGIVKVIGGLFKGDFGQIWDGIKTIFSGGIKALKGILEGAWKILKAPVESIAAGLTDAFKHTWDRIKGVFESGVNAVIDFLNILISAINVIPGVNIHKIGHVGGKAGGGQGTPETPAPHGGAFARGGAFGRTGGFVNTPITLMGEDAPRYPEWVIPTNPAYRQRAKGLLGQAAMSLGMASGGMYSQGEIMDLWTGQSGASSRRLIASAVAMAESGGNANATSANPAGGSNLGLWQIWSGNPGATLDPQGNARAAINLSRNGANWGLWEAFTNGAYKKFLGKGRAGGQPGGLPTVSDIVSKFPSPGDLPGMFQGLGKYVIGKATAYVRKQIGGLFQGQGDLGNKGTNSGLALGVQRAIDLATGMGWAYPSPGQLTGGNHVKGSLHYQGRAVDFGTAGHSPGQVMGLWHALVDKFGLGLNELFYDPAGRYIDAHHWVNGAIGGHGDHIHAGFRKGGKWLGSFKRGGVTRAEGLAHLHANEAVIPLKKGGHTIGKPTTIKGPKNARAQRTDTLANHWQRVAAGAALVAGMDPRNIPRHLGPVTRTEVSASDETVQENTDSNQALIDATNELAAQQARLADLQAQANANQLKILALTNQGPQILAAVVAAVSGGIGGKVGLGFQSPSYSGGMASYR